MGITIHIIEADRGTNDEMTCCMNYLTPLTKMRIFG